MTALSGRSQEKSDIAVLMEAIAVLKIFVITIVYTSNGHDQYGRHLLKWEKPQKYPWLQFY